MRQLLISQFTILDRLKRNPSSTGIEPNLHHDQPAFFDDLDEEEVVQEQNKSIPDDVPAGVVTAAGITIEVVPPEGKGLSMPSRWDIIDNTYGFVELDLRKQQAQKIISALRDLIAEKSFQYSHVIRVSPRKGVKTRARSVIAQLNDRIGYHCRLYTQCRSAMVRLGADDITLSKFRILERQDIRSSSALLNPNEPGSTRQHLSWIWQSGATVDGRGSLGLRECK
jgi:hypothetical protein